MISIFNQLSLSTYSDEAVCADGAPISLLGAFLLFVIVPLKELLKDLVPSAFLADFVPRDLWNLQVDIGAVKYWLALKCKFCAALLHKSTTEVRKTRSFCSRSGSDHFRN